MQFKLSGSFYAMSVAALFSLVTSASAAVMLQNGNFQTPQLTTSYTVGLPSGTDWTLLGGAGATGGLVKDSAAGFPDSHNDSAVQWCYMAPSSGGASEYLEQEIQANGVQAEKGKTIDFSFEQYYQTNEGSTKSADIQIRLEYGTNTSNAINDVIATVNFPGLAPGQSALRTGSITIPANYAHTGNLYLGFEAADNLVANFSSGLGNVSITDVAIDVAPLPTSAAMGLGGLVLAFAAARWQRSAARRRVS